MRSGPGPRALNAVIGAPRANVGVLRAAFRGPRWSQTGHATSGPAGVAGHCESANLSQRVAINLLHSQCERFSGTVRVGESVPVAHSESVREGLGMRSQVTLRRKACVGGGRKASVVTPSGLSAFWPVRTLACGSPHSMVGKARKAFRHKP